MSNYPKLSAENNSARQDASAAQAVPTTDAARAIGETGGTVPDSERLAFEAWMAGHCWALCATWDGKGYRNDAEQDGDIYPPAMRTRQLWAAWRDRAALAAQHDARAVQAGPGDAGQCTISAIETAASLRRDHRNDTYDFDTMIKAAGLLEALAVQPSHQAQQPASAPADTSSPLPRPSMHTAAHYAGFLRRHAHCFEQPKRGAIENAAVMIDLLNQETRRLHQELIDAQEASATADAPIGYLVVGKQSHGRFFTSKGMAEVEKANRDEGYGGEDETRIIPLCECDAPSVDAPKGEPSDEEIIDLAVEPLGIDFDRMPFGVVKFARSLLARYAAPALSKGEPVAWEWRFRALPDGPWAQWGPGRAPSLRADTYEVQERPLYTAPFDAAAIRNAALEEVERDLIEMRTFVGGDKRRTTDARLAVQQAINRVRALKTDQQETP